MPSVEVDDVTFRALALAARVAQTTCGEVVAKLITEIGTSHGEDGRDAARDAHRDPEWANRANGVAPLPRSGSRSVHARYMGHLFRGRVNLDTGATTVDHSPIRLPKADFTSPTAAARTVVEAANPGRAFSETNGRLFWIDDEIGQPIRELMGKR